MHVLFHCGQAVKMFVCSLRKENAFLFFHFCESFSIIEMMITMMDAPHILHA